MLVQFRDKSKSLIFPSRLCFLTLLLFTEGNSDLNQLYQPQFRVLTIPNGIDTF